MTFFRIVVLLAFIVNTISVEVEKAEVEGEDCNAFDAGFQIRGTGSGLCIAVAAGSTTNNAKIVTYLCDNLARSQWIFVPIAGDSAGFQIQNVASGLCIAVAAGAVNNNAAIVQYTCDNLPRSQWNIVDQSGAGTNVMIKGVGSGKCLAVAAGQSTVNTPLVLYDCDGLARSQWSGIDGSGTILPLRPTQTPIRYIPYPVARAA